jgi:hypothetical protein
MDLTSGGSRVSGRVEKRRYAGRCNSKKKMYYQEYAKAFGPTGLGKGQAVLQGTGGLTWRTGPVGPDPKEDSRKH